MARKRHVFPVSSAPTLFVDAAPFHGGAQLSLRDLMAGLDRQFYAPCVLSADGSEGGLLTWAREEKLKHERLPVQFWPHTFAGFRRASLDCWRARRLIRKWARLHETKLLFANGIRSALLARVAMLPEIPLIFHHRDWQCPSWALRHCVRHAAATIVASHAMLDHTREVVGDELATRINVIPNGIDFDALLAKAGELDFRKEFRWGDDPHIVTLVGDLVEWKRHELFLRAVAKARETDPAIFAFIIGGPRGPRGESYEDVLLKLAEELGITAAVAFTDHTENPAPLLEAANVHVSVARNEPFGRGVVEALYLGTPVVLTPGGGPEEICRGCTAARIVADDVDAVATGILAWIADDTPDSERLVDARGHAGHYNLAAMIARTDELLRACL